MMLVDPSNEFAVVVPMMGDTEPCPDLLGDSARPLALWGHRVSARSHESTSDSVDQALAVVARRREHHAACCTGHDHNPGLVHGVGQVHAADGDPDVLGVNSDDGHGSGPRLQIVHGLICHRDGAAIRFTWQCDGGEKDRLPERAQFIVSESSGVRVGDDVLAGRWCVWSHDTCNRAHARRIPAEVSPC